MSYCTHCGSTLPADARFCSNCGTPVGGARPSDDVRPSGDDGGPATGARPAAPAAATGTQPFAGLPVSDYVRDALAAAALLLSLFLPWTSTRSETILAAGRIEVVLITLLSLVSLTIPYLWRAGVLGRSWGFRTTQLARLAANAPYAVLVLVYLVIDTVDLGALGPAVAFGLAGALLAAQPRRAELAEGDAAADRRWLGVVLGTATLACLITIAQVVQVLLRHEAFDPRLGYATGFIVASIVLSLVDAAFLAALAVLVARGSDGARRIGIGVGVAGALLGLLGLSPQVSSANLSFQLDWPMMLLAFWLVFGAAVSAPSIERLCRPRPWRAAAEATTHVAWGASALVGLLAVIALFTVLLPGPAYGGNPIPWVSALLFGIFGVAGGLVARSFLHRESRQGHLVESGYAALLFVLGVALLVIWSLSPLGLLAPLILVLAFALPLGLVVAVWGPAASRRDYAALPSLAATGGFSFAGARSPAPATGAQAAPGAPTDPDAPAEPEGDAPDGREAPAPDPAARARAEAADPATPAARLHELAASEPSARAAIAANPATYASLLEWLGGLGDPEVDAALAARPPARDS